jgi:hypothetical protein
MGYHLGIDEKETVNMVKATKKDKYENIAGLV